MDEDAGLDGGVDVFKVDEDRWIWQMIAIKERDVIELLMNKSVQSWHESHKINETMVLNFIYFNGLKFANVYRNLRH